MTTPDTRLIRRNIVVLQLIEGGGAGRRTALILGRERRPRRHIVTLQLRAVTVSLAQRASMVIGARLAGRTLDRGCETLDRDLNLLSLRRRMGCVDKAYWRPF